MKWHLIGPGQQTGATLLVWRAGWERPNFMAWRTGVRGHEPGRWYDDGEPQWVPDEDQPTHYLDYPDPTA